MPPTEVDFPASARVLPRRIVKKTGTTRERTGCLTCRQRKKRCDLGHPLCKECVRLNFKCQWEDPRAFGNKNVSPKSQQISPIKNHQANMFRLTQNPDPLLFWVDEHADCTSSASRRHFLRYYTQTFSILLTSNMENNCFLSAFLPMAMYSPPLLTSLIAWSSAHLSLRDSSYLEVATRNRCVALRDLQDTLASDSGDVETTLAMSLVLCSLESIMADNGNAWYLHLMGAAGVITSKLNELDPVGGSEKIAEHMLAEFADAYTGRWLLRNFAYRDIVMSVAQDRPPLLNSHHFLTLDEPRLPDSHFGLASEILEIISITSRFKQNLENIFSTIIVADESDQCGAYYDPSGTQGLDFMTELDLLETRLIDWKCPASPDISLALLAESYRSSAIIHLYRVMRWACPERQDELSSKITGQVAAIVSSVAQMPTRSLPECALLFPLFLAGGEVTLKYHIQSIRNRMLDMIHSRAFRNVEVALSILEKLWERRSAVPLGESSVQTDWLDIVRQDGLYLSLS